MKNIKVEEANLNFKPINVSFTIETKKELEDLLEFTEGSDTFSKLHDALYTHDI